MTRTRTSLAALLLAGCAALLGAAPVAAQSPPSTLRVAGEFSANTHHITLERAFYEALPQRIGLPGLNITYNPRDQLGTQAADALRLLRSGAFDIMAVNFGNVSRDEPLLDGLDLIGVSPSLDEVRQAVDAAREVVDQRLQSRFGIKPLALWAFGPQIIFCNAPVSGLSDLRGLKVRSYTPSMSALLQSLGATPITLQFSEVYPALQRNVVTCGITSATSAHVGNWGEVITHILPLSVASGLQGHFINLATWRRFTPEQQQAIQAAYNELNDRLWALARTSNAQALACMSGGAACTSQPRSNNTVATVSDADRARLRDAVTEVVLPAFRDTCNRVWNQCSSTWNETVGRARGYSIN